MHKPLFILIIIVFLPLTGQAAESYTIDPSHTYPYFKISHLGFSNLQGRFNDTQGKITLDKAKKTGLIDITISAKSIDTGHAKRDKHLRSPDFFNVAEFPDISYKSTKVSLNDTKAAVEGMLTIAGVSKSIHMDVSNIHCGVHPFNKKDVCGFEATAKLKRSDFGLKYGLPAIGDEINLVFAVEAIKD